MFSVSGYRCRTMKVPIRGRSGVSTVHLDESEIHNIILGAQEMNVPVFRLGINVIIGVLVEAASSHLGPEVPCW